MGELTAAQDTLRGEILDAALYDWVPMIEAKTPRSRACWLRLGIGRAAICGLCDGTVVTIFVIDAPVAIDFATNGVNHPGETQNRHQSQRTQVRNGDEVVSSEGRCLPRRRPSHGLR